MQIFFFLSCTVLLLRNQDIDYEISVLFSANTGLTTLKITFLLVCLGSFVTIFRSFIIQNLNFFEFFSIYLVIVLSCLLLISARNLISVYVCFEVQALAFYILSCLKKDSIFSTEAGLKYFIYGSIFSGIYLFGSSLIYLILGTLSLIDIKLLLLIPLNLSGPLKFLLVTGYTAILVTFFFKLAIYPFHFLTPDIYEGAPLASSIIFLIIPKLSLFNFLLQFISIFNNNLYFYNYIFFIFCLGSALFGTSFAIQQTKLKKLFIYSSIVQTCFLIPALSAESFELLINAYFFLIIYLISSILIWSLFTFFLVSKTIHASFVTLKAQPFFISDLFDLFTKNTALAAIFSVAIFSLMGLPPLIGFFSKSFILFGLLELKLISLSIFLILIIIGSTFYYLRLLKIIFFENKKYNFKWLANYIVCNSNFVIIDAFLMSFLAMLIIISFFLPSLFILFSNIIALDSIIFKFV